MKGCVAFTPELRAQFMQERKAKKKVADAAARKVVAKAPPPTPVDARKKEVKAGGKNKK